MKYIIFLLTTLLLVTNVSVNAQRKPNVVLILTDDQGWGDLSLHGNPWLETPNIDSLARSGEQFKNFYVSPLCAPSRASILTGRYHLKTGVVSVSKGLEIMDPDETTLAEMFKANGYATGIFGKWHNGEHYPVRPNDQGFDEFLGFCAGHLSNYFDTELDHNGKMEKTKGFITDVLTDAALQFIDANKQQPFFCYIPYNAPHTPHQVPDKYFDKYKAKGLNNELSAIYGMVENVDDNVGRILSYLKQNNLEENTIVIFMSDNGPNGIRFNGVMKGIKGSVHEGGVRVPFFIRWKNHLPAGKIIDNAGAHIDIFPTLRELCNLDSIPGRVIDGISLAALLLGDQLAVKFSNRKLFTHVNFMTIPITNNSGGFRNDRYRFAFDKDNAEVYDLENDPGEQNDIAQNDSNLTKDFLLNYSDWLKESTKDLQLSKVTVLSRAGLTLPGYEATLSTGIKFKEGHGWAHDWVEKWNNPNDSMVWEIDCRKAGTYHVQMQYMCKPEDIGSVIQCRIGTVSKKVSIKDPYYSEQIQSPDRVPRKEAYEMKSWGSLDLGDFSIPEGKAYITLKALRVRNKNVAEVEQLRMQYAGK